MARVVIDRDEWYGWAAVDISPSKARGREVVLEVDEATARRWREATREFRRAMEEISLMMQQRLDEEEYVVP